MAEHLVPDGPRHVVLVGAMGSGKSTIGALLATALGRPFVDNDALLTQRTGSTAADIERQHGIDALHRAESEAVLAALGASAPVVLAGAASTVTDPRVRTALADAFVVWLRADHATLAARLPESATRPLAAEVPAELVTEQARERDPLFAQVANLVVASDAPTPDAVVAEIRANILERLPGPANGKG